MACVGQLTGENSGITTIVDAFALPKTGRRERLKENAAALDRPLTPEQRAELDRLFPPPTGPSALAVL